MAPSKQSRFPPQPCLPIKLRLLSVLTMILGPIFLIYLTLRCEKNQCILFQLPLVVPTHLGAYFSPLAFSIVVGFIVLMFWYSAPTTIDTLEEALSPSTGGLAIVYSSLFMFVLAYLKPDYISIVHGEYLRMLVTTTVICIIISLVLFALNFTGWEFSTLLSLSTWRLGNIEMKYFFYVLVGFRAWAMLDQLIALNVIVEYGITAPVAFLLITQLLFITFTLFCERFMKAAAFALYEGLGFNWLIWVMYMPFFHSLPLYYAATTEMVLSKLTILADCVFFLLGFVLSISTLFIGEMVLADPRNFKKLTSDVLQNGKPVLVSEYWEGLQIIHCLGCMIMWTSWIVLCGFNGLSIILLLVKLLTLYMGMRQCSVFNEQTFRRAWTRDTKQVAKHITIRVF